MPRLFLDFLKQGCVAGSGRIGTLIRDDIHIVIADADRGLGRECRRESKQRGE
jgi:hypothetical protein